MSDIKRNHSFCRHNPLNIKNSRIKHIYYGIIERCYNPQRKDYKFYGGKDVTVCKEWLNYPEEFESWCFNHGYGDNLSIDRIQSDNGYSPENCRWISPEENSRDKKSTRYIDVGEYHLTGRQWANKLGVGTNFINTYYRKNGKDATIEYIKEKLS